MCCVPACMSDHGNSKEPSRPRRAFLADVWRWAGLGLVVGGGVLTQRMLRGAVPEADVVRLDAAQLTRLEAEGRLVLPGYFVFGTAEKPRALRMRCTHLGCTLRHEGETRRFVCPCHGSRFDEQGKVLAGPATEALTEVAVLRSDR